MKPAVNHLGQIATRARVTSRPFGEHTDGRTVDMFVIETDVLEMRAITLGAIITSLRMRSGDGEPVDVVLGHDRLEPYFRNPAYLGAVVGRYANRIAGGRFELDGLEHQLATNDRGQHLHGGIVGFDQLLWTAQPIETRDGCGVLFSRTSPAGEEQYPGTLKVRVAYLLSGDTVIIRYLAVTDAATIVNLTQHTYFNLAGQTSRSTLDHELTIHADAYTPVDDALIPSGELARVQGTPFDFTRPIAIGAQLCDHDQLRLGHGYDHNLVLRGGSEGELAAAATLRDPASGRALDIATSEPGLQFYGGQLLDGAVGAYGRVFDPYAGLCLETQHFPDSPHHAQFPSVTLRPGERFRSVTAWRFTTA